MKQKIEFEIEVPEGKRAVWKGNEIVFEDIKPQLPKTWEEFIKNSKYYTIKESYHISTCKRYKHNTYNYPTEPNLLVPNFDIVKQHFALIKLHWLRDCYRQGWEPDLVNTKTEYIINNIKGRYEVKAIIGAINHFLSFQSEEIADEFLNNFRDLIEKAGDLI